MIRKWLILIIIIIIFLPLIFTTTFISEQVSGVPCGYPDIAIIEQSKTAYVGPSENGTVTFDGIVSVTLNQATKVVVYLTADDTWDSSVVTPSSILFESNGDKSFTVWVTAPPKTSFSNTGTVTVTGSWSMYPGGLTGPANPQQGAVARIGIAKYESFSINSSHSYISISPGDDAKFEFTVENQGNYLDDSFNDKFSINILNEVELNDKGFEISIDKKSDNKPISINVESPESISGLGYNHIDVQVSYTNSSSGESQIENLTFVVRIPEDKTIYTSEVTYLIIFIIGIVVITIGLKVIRKLRKKLSNSKGSK